MSETGLIDFAGLEDSVAATTEVETTEVETPETTEAVETTEAPESVDSEVLNADGTPKTEAQKAEDKAAKVKAAEPLPGDKNTPDGIRKALKALKDASPENAGAVKELHGAYERWNAAKAIFPKGVAEMKDAKAFIDLVGGAEGYEGLTQKVQAIEDTDALLYAGDPKIWDNVIEDLKSEGKLDALGKLAPSFLDNLKENDKKGYYSAFAPHFYSGLLEVNMEGAIGGLLEALTLPEGAAPEAITAALTKAREVAGGMDKWFKGLQAVEKKAKEEAVNPERQKLEEERKAFKAEQEKFKTEASKKVQTEIVTECDKYNNKALGTALGPYLKMAFFKGFPRETLIDLGNGIKSRLFDSLEKDATYQAQMKAFWRGPTPNRAKITEYHNAKLDSIAEDIVRQTVQQRYPGYAKGGSAAGRVAAATEKKAETVKTDAAAVASGKPVYVAVKPKWEAIDWDKDPKQHLYITGKAFLKGSGKLVTWRR